MNITTSKSRFKKRMLEPDTYFEDIKPKNLINAPNEILKTSISLEFIKLWHQTLIPNTEKEFKKQMDEAGLKLMRVNPK